MINVYESFANSEICKEKRYFRGRQLGKGNYMEGECDDD